MSRALLVLAVLLTAALGGCIRADQATGFRATASSPTLFQGYDHAAAAGQAGTGTLTLDLDPAADTGSVVATFAIGGQQWRVESLGFAEAPGRAFQEGGIRANFDEHGDSGNGDGNLPRFHALAAAWGTGRVTLDGQPFLDPLTGSDTFAFHAMVARDAPREPGTLRALKADGATPYDPATPADGKVFPSTAQALLNLQSTSAAPPEDLGRQVTDTVAAPDYQRSEPFEINSTAATIWINLTVSEATPLPLPVPLPGVGELRFDLVDPSGNVTGSFPYTIQNPTPGPVQGSISLASPLPSAGTWSLLVTGRGVGAGYTADLRVEYAAPLFLHVVYSDVQVG